MALTIRPDGPGGAWRVPVGLEAVDVEPATSGDVAWLTVIDERGRDAGEIGLGREAALELAGLLREFGETGRIAWPR